MAAKKAASKKRKTTSRKKVSKKKVTAKKQVAKKTASRKKVAKKQVPRKAGKKKVSKKKPAVKKKSIKKKVTPKKVSKKKTASKKVSKNKAPVKKAAAQKTVAKKSTSTKKTPVKATPVVKKKLPVRTKVPPPRRRSRSNALSGPIHGIAPYKPIRGEEYMSEEQIQHFRKILSAWKNELMFEVDRTVHHMQDEAANFPDPNDRATQEAEFGLELRTRDRERKLLRKIDSALSRLDDGSYGFCDETGEDIGLKRLEARPVATLSLEAQERREMSERQFRDRDDHRYR